MIRPATIGDLDVVMDMAVQFYATTEYRNFAPFKMDTGEVLFRYMLDEGVVLVAEDEGVVVGMTALILTEFMFNTDYKSAHEVCWWVNPGSRAGGIGIALLRAIEPACRAKGATLIQMMSLSTSPPQVDVLYRRAGYDLSEKSFVKMLGAN